MPLLFLSIPHRLILVLYIFDLWTGFVSLLPLVPILITPLSSLENARREEEVMQSHVLHHFAQGEPLMQIQPSDGFLVLLPVFSGVGVEVLHAWLGFGWAHFGKGWI